MSTISASAREDASLLLHCFYKAKNPEKIDSITSILERYEGREGLLYANLMEKYEITTLQIIEEFPELEEAHTRLLKLLEAEEVHNNVLTTDTDRERAVEERRVRY